MALVIAAGFKLGNSEQPNFTRDQFKSYDDMRAVWKCDDGHIAYCTFDEKYYQFLGDNDEDDVTGKWREYSLGGLSEDQVVALVRKYSQKKEVLIVNALPTASADTMDRLYLTPVTGTTPTVYNENITTKALKTSTIYTEGPDPLGIETDFVDGEVAVGDYYLGLYKDEDEDESTPAIFQCSGFVEGVPTWGLYMSVANEDFSYGDTILTNDQRKMYRASETAESGWVEEAPYTYAWAVVGVTSFDMTGKQDAFTAVNNVVTAWIQGTEYMFSVTPLVAPVTPTMKIEGISITSGTTKTYNMRKATCVFSCGTSGATVYWTVGDTTPADPTISSSTGNLVIDANANTGSEVTTKVIKARAYKNGKWSDNIYTATIKVKRQVETPVFTNLTGNDYSTLRDVTLGCSTSDATVYYTTDGTEPTNTSSNFPATETHTFEDLSEDTTIKAKAVATNWLDSEPVTLDIIVGFPKTYYGMANSVPTTLSGLGNLTPLELKSLGNGQTVSFQYSGSGTQYIVFALPTAVGTLTYIDFLTINGEVNSLQMNYLQDFSTSTTVSGYTIYYKEMTESSQIKFK